MKLNTFQISGDIHQYTMHKHDSGMMYNTMDTRSNRTGNGGHMGQTQFHMNVDGNPVDVKQFDTFPRNHQNNLSNRMKTASPLPQQLSTFRQQLQVHF